MLPSTHQSMLSRMLPIALDGTLPVCLTVHSQLSSQDALNCARWHTLSLLDCMLPSKHSRRSEAHSRAWFQLHSQLHSMTLPAYLALPSQIQFQEAKHSQSHLTICSHVCSYVLDPETCWVGGARNREAWGWWRVVGGWWWVTGGVCWPKPWRRSIS